jgi:hypothetical protein
LPKNSLQLVLVLIAQCWVAAIVCAYAHLIFTFHMSGIQTIKQTNNYAYYKVLPVSSKTS